MKRRGFFATLAGLAVTPLCARGETAEVVEAALPETCSCLTSSRPTAWTVHIVGTPDIENVDWEWEDAVEIRVVKDGGKT